MNVEILDFVRLYVDMLGIALPLTIFFGLGNVIVNMFCAAAFGGKLFFGGKIK